MSNTPTAFIASGDINPCRFVTRDSDANYSVSEADANEIVAGISGSGTRSAPYPGLASALHAAANDTVVVHQEPDDEVLLEAGGTFNAGDRLKSDADGKGVAIAGTGTTIQHFGAIANEAATASGQLVRVKVKVGSERPALA